MKTILFILFFLPVIVIIQGCGWTPVQATYKQKSLFPSELPVYGFSTGLLSEVKTDVNGLSVGFNNCHHIKRGIILSFTSLNEESENYGLELGLALLHQNVVIGYSNALNYGCAIAAFWNCCGENYGLSVCGGATDIKKNYGVSISGLNFAIDNSVQIGVVNIAANGFQLGLLNRNKTYDEDDPEVDNFAQIGIVNTTQNGFQMGILNYNENSLIPYFPLFNYSSKSPSSKIEEKVIKSPKQSNDMPLTK